MNSNAVPSFWERYRNLDQSIRSRAKKAYILWTADPFHPSLRFKCINHSENIWAVRVTIGYRALGVLDGDTITWFWIGSHDEYERYFG
jgi:hypothetical protein